MVIEQQWILVEVCRVDVYLVRLEQKVPKAVVAFFVDWQRVQLAFWAWDELNWVEELALCGQCELMVELDDEHEKECAVDVDTGAAVADDVVVVVVEYPG